jgi:hypothetical protein
MTAKGKPRIQGDDLNSNPRDIFFECPACNKSLVVDETVGGMMVECPKCHINVIVPPQAQMMMPPPHSAASEAPARPVEPPKAVEGIAEAHQRLNVLASQMREQQTQWAEVTNRIASHINEVNRELVMLGRLEASHKQVLKEWNQLVGEIAASSQSVAQQVPPVPPKK